MNEIKSSKEEEVREMSNQKHSGGVATESPRPALERCVSTMRHWLRVLLTPACWLLNNRVDRQWDHALNEMLDRKPMLKLGYLTVSVDGFVIWAGNYPYAYGTPRDQRLNDSSLMPSRRTIFRLHDLVSQLHQATLTDRLATIKPAVPLPAKADWAATDERKPYQPGQWIN